MSQIASSAAVTFRLVRNDDHAALLEHLQTSFDGWPSVDISVTAIDHLRWKLGDGWPGDVYNYVAELDGRIVAAQLHQLWRFKAGGRQLLACRGWDASVHPDYRGSGIMSQMRPFMIGDMPQADFLFGAARHPAIAKLYDREPRLHFAHRWWVLRCPFSVREAVSTFKLRPGRSLPKLVRSLGAFARWRRAGAPDSERSFTLRTVERFDERIDSFCRDASAPFDFAVVRTRDVLNWRYADPRAGAFTIRLAEHEDRLLGYAVLRTTRNVGYIADILALPGRLDVVDALARDGAQQLRKPGTAAAECWLMANHPYAPVLSNAGFLGRRMREPPTFEPMSVPEREMTFLSGRDIAVHLTVGDMDII